MKGPHVRLGAIAPLLASFTFPSIASCSTLRIGQYLFYIEKFIIQFETTEKNYESPHSFSKK